MKCKYSYTILFVLFVSVLVFPFSLKGKGNENVLNTLTEIKKLIEKEEYETAIVKLNDIEQICMTDTSAQVKKDFNLNMGAALFFTEKYEQAIPYLQSGLQQMSYKPDDGDCNYLETLYGIASCYNNIKDYKNAESYYRKAIIINDIQPFACRIITQVYTELIELYTKTNQFAQADLCTKYLEQHQLGLRTLKGKHNDWLKIVEEIYAPLPSFDLLKPEDKPKVIETYSSILDIINTNIGKNNDEYILYCSLYATTMQYKYYDTIAAKDINMQLIDIGRKLSVHKPEIASAYEDYLRLASGQNEVSMVKNILPEAIEYYRATTNKNRDEANLYEVVGLGFCHAGNQNVGVPYLENEMESGYPVSLAALGYLADYYYKSAPSKALSYFYKAEEQIDKIGGITNETKIFAYDNIMQLNTLLGNYSEAIAYGNKLTQLISAKGNIDRLSQHLTDCGVIYAKEHNLSNALTIFGKIDSIYNTLSEDYKIYYLSNKGFTYLICDEYDKAINYLKQSIEIAIQNLGESYFQLETIYHNLGRAYMLQQNYKEAIVWLQKSYDLQITNNGNVIENTIKYINECEANK